MRGKKIKKDPSLQPESTRVLRFEKTTRSEKKIIGFKTADKDSNKVIYHNRERIIKDDSIQPKKIKQTNYSTSLEKPGSVGSPEETENWKICVIEHFRKEDAIKLIKQHNSFFDKASSGKYYLAVRVSCTRIGGKEEFLDLGNHYFDLVGDKKRVYRSQFLGLEPQVYSTMLLGGIVEGWVTFEVFEEDDNFILLFGGSSFWNAGNKIYISLD